MNEFKRKVIECFIIWIRKYNMLMIITAMTVWTRDVVSVDPDGSKGVFRGCPWNLFLPARAKKSVLAHSQNTGSEGSDSVYLYATPSPDSDENPYFLASSSDSESEY